MGDAMKLPRWLVFAMLFSSLLSVLAAAGWWWVTWPERTAREFVSLLQAGDDEHVRNMIIWDNGPTTRTVKSIIAREPADYPPEFWTRLQPLQRSLQEVIIGTHRFRFINSYNPDFVVERGQVRLDSTDMYLLISDGNSQSIRPDTYTAP
jgi:hypothetical protein